MNYKEKLFKTCNDNNIKIVLEYNSNEVFGIIEDVVAFKLKKGNALLEFLVHLTKEGFVKKVNNVYSYKSSRENDMVKCDFGYEVNETLNFNSVSELLFDQFLNKIVSHFSK